MTKVILFTEMVTGGSLYGYLLAKWRSLSPLRTQLWPATNKNVNLRKMDDKTGSEWEQESKTELLDHLKPV